MGIYISLYLAKAIMISKKLTAIFAFLGKYSFEIMAAHFIVIKCIDRVYAYIIGEKDISVFAKLPSAYSHKLWWVYAILATVLPAVVGNIIMRLQRRVK